MAAWNVVGINAVRDLFGTNQPANHKPITHISGSELLGLLAKHGHKARINIAEARAMFPRLS